ncbi:hypothetical protein [Pseudoxanthomonas wuyuanensis]|uniref:Uncharacterized protein n=1 Tax=Pseudoxanthomonas wuyuanensis TaxID=1073196 RepID=A0A286D7Z1_9GAMM|nr:hypothetical protein [Pseudoxanthomonas wuyuanensis]SOD54776.1 hypothetical protein SAMN06296416_10536 [Pseudoxanthomonas wuyuanensis]
MKAKPDRPRLQQVEGANVNRSICIALMLMVLGGCDRLSSATGLAGPSGESVGTAGEKGPDVAATRETTDLQDSSEPLGGAYSDAKPPSPPPDGVQYERDVLEVKRAWDSRNRGRLIGLPSGISDSGYPLWPATCEFYSDSADCRMTNGARMNEMDVVNGVTVIRNIDVIKNPELICGDRLCVNHDGTVLGHVSTEMQEWRNRYCSWTGNGTPECP